MVTSLPGNDGLFQIPLEGSFSPLGMGMACALLVIAAFGAHGAAALMLYSPTKLARRLSGKGTSHKDVDDRIATLKAQSRELQVTARLLAIGGVVGAVFLTHQSVRGTLGGMEAFQIAPHLLEKSSFDLNENPVLLDAFNLFHKGKHRLLA